MKQKHGRFSGHSDFPHSTPSSCIISRFCTFKCEYRLGQDDETEKKKLKRFIVVEIPIL